jgi:hypothetical protein
MLLQRIKCSWHNESKIFTSTVFTWVCFFLSKNISVLNKIFDDFYGLFGFALYSAESYHVLLWKKKREYIFKGYKQKMLNAFREGMQTILWLKSFFVHGPLFANFLFDT